MDTVVDILVKLRAFRGYYRTSQAEFRERRRRENEPLRRWLGLNKPRTMTRIALYIHAAIATVLYVGTLYWLIIEYTGLEKAVPRGTVLLPFVLPAIYLWVVHIVISNTRRGDK